MVKKQMKPKHFPLIPTMANDSFLEGNEGNMGEIVERTQGWENLGERARLSATLWALLGKIWKIIPEVLEMPGAPQKQKWAAGTITKQTQKLAKKTKTSDNKIFSFSHSFPLRPQPPN
jgi:hypothetical protein